MCTAAGDSQGGRQVNRQGLRTGTDGARGRAAKRQLGAKVDAEEINCGKKDPGHVSVMGKAHRGMRPGVVLGQRRTIELDKVLRVRIED